LFALCFDLFGFDYFFQAALAEIDAISGRSNPIFEDKALSGVKLCAALRDHIGGRAGIPVRFCLSLFLSRRHVAVGAQAHAGRREGQV